MSTTEANENNERSPLLGLGYSDGIGLLPTSAEDIAGTLGRLSKTPAEAYERGYMDGHARGVEMATAAMRIENDRMRAWIENDCYCPCCAKIRQCVDGCTFDHDCPSEAERMHEAREALYGADI